MLDRLRKAREEAGYSKEDFAVALEVSRNTIGNYESGKVRPQPVVIKMWALVTGVPVEWLRTGDAPGGGGLPRLDSNQQPSVSPSAQVSGTVTEVDFTTRAARKHRLRPAAGPAEVIPLHRPELANTG